MVWQSHDGGFGKSQSMARGQAMPMTRTAMTPVPLWQVGRGLPEAGAAGAVGAVLPEVPGDRAADGESGGAGADAAALPARGEAAPAEEPGKRGAFPAHGASSFPWGLPLSNLAAKTPPFGSYSSTIFSGLARRSCRPASRTRSGSCGASSPRAAPGTAPRTTSAAPASWRYGAGRVKP